MSIIQNDHSEGPVAKAIERQTSKLPSDLFLWAAFGSMAASATLKIFRKDKTALFVGQWAAPFLLLGIYNKIVKVEGSDKKSKQASQSSSPSPTELHPISDFAEPEGNI
ncbi:hypothetical protein R1T16_01915 [Flavobacterium sp. DG1-102-2]|uniref:hypothetical protein n=1 Tax=Flavobacterium sp. DG1-102-2 TaxID=3081663 RepID=UPI002949B7F6|nr:hypothetical protein [Flavobacterium sp. DG1-102-2]MDV6167161.1 hypothetical protein [Flavobacterium sp. DG1-102-2]